MCFFLPKYLTLRVMYPRQHKMCYWRHLFALLILLCSAATISMEASQRNMKAELQKHIYRKKALNNLMRRLDHTKVGASKVPRSQSALSQDLSVSEKQDEPVASTVVVEEVHQAGLAKESARSKINVINALSARRNLVVFDLNALVGGEPPVRELRLYLHVNNTDKNEQSSPRTSKPSEILRSSANRKARRKGKKRRWRRQSKIRVFLTDSKGKRNRRITELRKEIGNSSRVLLKLPVSLISSLSKNSTDNRLYLRLRCKRCSRNTHFLIRGEDSTKRCENRKKKKKSKRRQRRRNRKRPRKLRRKNRLWKNCGNTTLTTFIYRDNDF